MKALDSFNFPKIILILSLIVMLSPQGLGQDCKFPMQMGETYDKCSAVCLGRKFKCVGDGTCLCQQCPNNKQQSFMNTHDDIECESNQECSRRCIEVNTEPEHGGFIGKGALCSFQDDFYGRKSSVCVCGCL